MARFFIGLVVLVALGAGIFWGISKMQGDGSRMIALTFGNPSENKVDMHMDLSTTMADRDTIPFSSANGSVNWKKWANAHFVVTDSQGDQVSVMKEMRSDLVSESDHRGLADSFIVCTLEQGEAYTFDYIPVAGKPEKFRYEFTAPTSEFDRDRVKFMPVK